MNQKSFVIPGMGDSVIRGDVHLPQGDNLPVVIFCHGFKGFKDWGCWSYVGDELAKKGFAFVRFNFSHNGVGENLSEFTELDRFKLNTYSLEAEDLGRVLQAVADGNLPGAERFDRQSIGVIGHSRGGAAALCGGGAHDAVKAITTLASVCTLGDIPTELEQQWRSEGVRYLKNMRTGQEMPLGLGLLEDILSGQDRIENAARSLNKPLLVIHGDEDEAVPFAAAEKMHSWAPNSELRILPGAGHTFGAKHPFEGSTEELSEVLKLCSEFFARHLCS